MKITNYSVNDKGIKEIKQFLSNNHKLGGAHFTQEMLYAWAANAEFQLEQGNTPTIELNAWESIYNRAQEFEISDLGIDKEIVEVD